MAAGTIDRRGPQPCSATSPRLYFTIPPEDWFRLLYQWLFSPPFFADEANVASAAAASTAYAHRQSPGDFARQVAAIDRALPVDLSPIKCPVLALSGGRDLLAPPGAVEQLHTKIQRLSHQTIPYAAHSLHWEAPQSCRHRDQRFPALDHPAAINLERDAGDHRRLVRAQEAGGVAHVLGRREAARAGWWRGTLPASPACPRP